MEAPERTDAPFSHELHSTLAPQSAQLNPPVSTARATKAVQRPNDDPALRAQVQPRQPQCRLQLHLVDDHRGRPDPLFGEEPVAFVVLRPGLAAEPDELIEHCKNVLAKFKVPRAVFVEANLPRTPIGKIAKPVLRERISFPTARTT